MARGDARDALLLAGLLSGKTPEQAAETAGYSRSTAQRRMVDPGFRKRLDDAIGEVLDRSVAHAVSFGGEALNVLRAIATDESLPATVRSTAAARLHEGQARAVDVRIRYRSFGQLAERLAQLEELIRSRLDGGAGGSLQGLGDALDQRDRWSREEEVA